MSSTNCLRCLMRPEIRNVSSRFGKDELCISPFIATFSTSARCDAKKGPNTMVLRNRTATNFKAKKKGAAPTTKSNAPQAGERKALRKRIVLSNTSALEVQDLKEMAIETMQDAEQIGKVVALPGPIVDQLRAAQAFRKTQSWNLFRRPSMLLRKETVELAKEMESVNDNTVRHILTGSRGSGKSLLLLQAMAMAFQKGWIVISIPEAHYLVDGSSDYKPVPNTRPIVYEQGQYSMEMLRRIVAANPTLSKTAVKLQHKLPTALKADATLYDLCDIGVEDTDIAPAILMAFLKELDQPGRPPALFALDGLAHVMKNSNYKSASFEAIHAHEFSIVQWFLSYLSGEKKLSSGGMVIAATSASNDPAVESMDFRLRQLEIKQAIEKGYLDSAQRSALSDPVMPFLLATGQQPNPVPQPDPYYKYDERVFKALGTPFDVVAGNRTANGMDVNVLKLNGMTKEEARGLMEYWAKSGMMKQEVNERLVGEKWSLAGGGVVGELERGCVRFRM